MLHRLLLLMVWTQMLRATDTITTMGKHIGIFSGEVEKYHVTVPVRLQQGEGREKRSVEDNSIRFIRFQLQLGHDDDDEVVIELEQRNNFISPHLVIETRSASSASSRTKSVLQQHHILGVILSDKHGEYWLEPTTGGAAPDGEREHIVFKRTTTVPDSKKKKRKKKKRHEKNCGTREPRRLTEMRLEWQQQPGKVKVQGRGRSRKSRWRRSVSRDSHVEALVVADTSMMKFHRDTYVETYLLTIMNMVSALYQDPSIGNLINIVVVNIILLEEESQLDGLNVTTNADNTLESFCKWQERQNYPGEEHPNHHDVAILITRVDICARQNTPCGTLGVAHVGGMCQRERSCNVNEDNGITLAHTITHELGHNFGMYHDTEKIGCSRREGSTQHVMTPSFEADTVEIAWSPCSRRDITNFLDKQLGQCLEDKPTVLNFSYPELPAGAMYDAEYQCQLQFGDRGTEVCTPLPEICSRLWCVVDGVCTTMLKPAAPGTSCGKHMWCQNQECVSMGEKPEPVHGGWSEWAGWSECSRTCGAGVAIQERYCTLPVPAFGGRYCTGERRRYKVCNTEECPENNPSFRAVQCSSFDNEFFHGNKYKWVPYFDKADPCELYCADEEDTIIVPWGESALDGTPCRLGTRDMCIRGICKHVGCDWVVDSEAKEDKCGICHGNGEQCHTVAGVFSETFGSGYTEVVTVPRGARNIHITELGSSKNYIGIGSIDSHKFYLNGKLEITISGEYEIAGASGLYERDKDVEKIHIPGPIKDDIIVYIIFRGKYKNLGVAYNFTIPKQVPTTHRKFEWHFSEWSPCSATCGSGVQSSVPVCKERTLGVVEEAKCRDEAKPGLKKRVCNTHHCPTRWWTGPWQLCPSTCGESSKVFRKRTVLCIEQTDQEPTVFTQPPGLRHYGGIEYVRDTRKQKEYTGHTGQEVALPDMECEGQDKPIEKELCPNLQPCSGVPTTEPPLTSTAPPPPLDTDFIDYDSISEKDNLEFLNFLNISYDWINGVDKKDKKQKKSEPATTSMQTPTKEKKHKKHKKIKRKKKEKYKKIPRNEEVEELQNDSTYDELRLRKLGQKKHAVLGPLRTNKASLLSYVYYGTEGEDRRPK